MRQRFESKQQLDAHRAAQKIPDFVPSWMLAPDRIFDPRRALRSAVNMGDPEFAGKLIDHYNLWEDRAAVLRRASLNNELIDAIFHKGFDVDRVRTLLDQGASPHAATWNHPRSEWFSMVLSAVIVAGSSSYTKAENEASFDIAVLLMRRGASVSFLEAGHYDYTATRAHHQAMQLTREPSP